MTSSATITFPLASVAPNQHQQEQRQQDHHHHVLRMISPTVAFLLVSLSLGELGDGLNIFQGIYLVGVGGWNEGSVGTALSLMGLTALICQTFAGDFVDKTTIDRRRFLSVASVATAMSASMIFFVKPAENSQHILIFISKIIEGISSSFIGPCLAALTLATFGPNHFDTVMASNALWGHVGSVVAAVIAGVVAYWMYPSIQYCFVVIAASALTAVFFVQFLPEGDKQMGRGFYGTQALDEHGHIEQLTTPKSKDEDEDGYDMVNDSYHDSIPITHVAASYWDVLSNKSCIVVCLTGFFFHFANANVLLVLGELMGGGGEEDEGPSQAAIPLIAGAIVLAQVTMAAATWTGDKLTNIGIGRKPLFLFGLLTLPLRCALIIHWKDSGDAFLLSTQILDGLGGGMFGLLHPFIVADITFGSGRFNLVMGLTASMFGLGGTLSNYLGQQIVEKFGHVASLSGSFFLSFIPIIIFSLLMPETLGDRGSIITEPKHGHQHQDWQKSTTKTEDCGSGSSYVQMT